MSSALKYLEQTFRFVAIVGVLVALAGVVAAAAAVLAAAETSGVSVPITVSLSEQQIELYLVSGFVAFVGGLVLNLAANTIASFVGGFRSGPAGSATGDGSAADGSAATPTPERYRAKLERTYLWLTLFVGLLLVGGLTAGAVVPSGGGFSSIPNAVLAFAALALTILFGGVAGGAATTAILAALWYGVREGASEALVGGTVVGLLFIPVAIVLGSVGWVFFGAWLVYYSLRARGATEFVLVDRAEVPGFVRKLAP